MAVNVVRKIFRRAIGRGGISGLESSLVSAIRRSTERLTENFGKVLNEVERTLGKNLDRTHSWKTTDEARIILRPRDEFIKDVQAIETATRGNLADARMLEEHFRDLVSKAELSKDSDAISEARNLLVEASQVRHHAGQAHDAAKNALAIAKQDQQSQVLSVIVLGQAKDHIAKAHSLMVNVSKASTVGGAALAGVAYQQNNRSTATAEAVKEGVFTAIDYTLSATAAAECVLTLGVGCATDVALEYGMDKAVKVGAPVVVPVVSQVMDWGSRKIETAAAGVKAVAGEAGDQLNQRVGTKLDAAFRVPENAARQAVQQASGGSWWPSPSL
jgi:hypothetical protein